MPGLVKTLLLGILGTLSQLTSNEVRLNLVLSVLVVHVEFVAPH